MSFTEKNVKIQAKSGLIYKKEVVGDTGFEPVTSTV